MPWLGPGHHLDLAGGYLGSEAKSIYVTGCRYAYK